PPRNFSEMIPALAARGITVFVTTHYMDEAEHCDELALIYAGKVVAAGSPSSLKAQYMREALLEVDCGDLMAGYAALKGAPGLSSVALFGKYLHVLTPDEQAARTAITARLASRAVALRQVQRTEPSLEGAVGAVMR